MTSRIDLVRMCSSAEFHLAQHTQLAGLARGWLMKAKAYDAAPVKVHCLRTARRHACSARRSLGYYLHHKRKEECR